MVYSIKMTRAIAGDGTDSMSYFRESKKTYPTQEKARAAAFRQVNFLVGFYECSIYKVEDGKKTKIGAVVFDQDYCDKIYGGNTRGIFYVPKGCDHEGYRAKGVSANGSFNKMLYRLT